MSDSNSKACRKCAGTDFNNSGQCRACQKARSTKYYALNKEKMEEQGRQWRLANSDRVNENMKAWKEANKVKVQNSTKKHAALNPGKAREYSQKYLKTNRQKALDRCAAYYQENKDKVRQYNADHPLEGRHRQATRRARKMGNGGALSKGISDDLYASQKGLCACCGKPLNGVYHLDHIIPLARGGPHEDGNMQLLLPRCNREKGAKSQEEFIRMRASTLHQEG